MTADPNGTVVRIFSKLYDAFRQQLDKSQTNTATKEGNSLVRKLKEMIRKAKGRREVTLAALRRLARCAASERCIREALKKKGIK